MYISSLVITCNGISHRTVTVNIIKYLHLQTKYQVLTKNIYICLKSLKIPKGGNQNPQIDQGQTTQWPKEKVQKEKQRSIKHTHKTKDRVTRTPLKTGDELRCFGSISSSCSITDTRRVYLLQTRRWYCKLKSNKIMLSLKQQCIFLQCFVCNTPQFYLHLASAPTYLYIKLKIFHLFNIFQRFIMLCHFSSIRCSIAEW